MGVDLDAVLSINSKAKGNGIFHRKVVQLTNAEIKALRGSPKELVPAPGAGWFLVLQDVVLILNAGTNVLTETVDNLVVEYGSGQDATGAIETTGFIDQAVDQVAIVYAAPIATMTAANLVNKNLRLFNTGDGEIAGNAALDATMTVIVNYQMHKSYL